MRYQMLKSNQIDAKSVFIADSKTKFVENPIYFNMCHRPVCVSSVRPSVHPPLPNKLFFCCKVGFLLQIFVLIFGDCTAER